MKTTLFAEPRIKSENRPTFPCEISTLGQLSLASLWGRLIEYQLRLGQRWECHLCRVAGNTVGWQVIPCDPMWHVSSRSGVATLQTAIHLLLTYFTVYWKILCTPPYP